MIQNVLRHMGGVENYGIISLILFIAFFLGMLVWALLLKKPFLKDMSRLPLETDLDDSDTGTHNNE